MKTVLKYLLNCRIKLAKFNRQKFILRKKILNTDMTIISSNCIAGIIYNDLKLRFMSPTINLYFQPNDFIKFLSNLEFYLNAELEEYKDSDISFPIGILNNEIKIYFMHYKSFNDAKIKWTERCKRVNLKNIYVIMTDRDNCTLENIKDFENLSYQNKIIFTSKKYEFIKSSVYCSEYKNEKSVGMLMDFRNILGYRQYDKYFDFIKWFNGR